MLFDMDLRSRCSDWHVPHFSYSHPPTGGAVWVAALSSFFLARVHDVVLALHGCGCVDAFLDDRSIAPHLHFFLLVCLPSVEVIDHVLVGR